MKKQLLFIAVSIFSVSAFSQNLIADYNFDNDTTDGSGNGYHLETYGSVTEFEFTSPAETGLTTDGCVHFKHGKGLKSSITLDNTTWQGTSIAFWIKDSINASLGFIVQSGTGFGVKLNSSGFINCFFNGSAAGSLNSNSTINDGDWHHIVVQNDGSTTSMYIDGIFETSHAETMYHNSGVYYYIGTDNVSNQTIDAFIDDFKLYDDTLTQAQITQLAEINSGLSVQQNLAEEVTIYPNPAKDYLSIFEMNSDISSISIMSITGEVVRTFIPISNVINITDLAKGVYILHIQIKEGMLSKKFIKE